MAVKVKVKFTREGPDEFQAGLFDLDYSWHIPARDFAASLGLAVDKFAANHRVMIGGRWYRVEWNGRWEFPPA